MIRFEKRNPDLDTTVFTLTVAENRIVFIQAVFESYEGLGIVRTVNQKTEESGFNQIEIITTPSLESVCEQLLLSI